MNNFIKNNESKCFAFGTIFLWASAFPVTKIALSYFTPQTLGLVRYLSATICLLLIGYIKKIGLPKTRDIPKFLFSGGMGFFLYMITFNTGSIYLTSATSSIIIAIAPILTALMSNLLLKEKINVYGWIAISMEFVGILFLTLWNGEFSLNIGALWMIGAAFVLAIYNITQREYTKTYTPFQSTTYSIIGGTVLLSIFVPESTSQIMAAPLKAWGIIIYLGIFPSAIAYIWWSRALSIAKITSEVTNFMFVTPLLSGIMGCILVNEYPSLETYVGGTIILSGLMLFNLTNKNDIKGVKFYGNNYRQEKSYIEKNN
ncbi:DMT family transporter [Fusobacterium sp. MFO224]|uniref:DMT family transporter n=1 Tax=Fusobacterium sp. MFO224 TaxID=3378070 RepID=UPI003853AFA2